MRLSPVFDPHDPDMHTYLKKTVPLILGLGMTFSNEIFFRFFGSFLPEGATSSVNYALRTTMMLVAIFGQASGVAFYPFLTKLAAERKFGEMERLLHSVIRKIAMYLIPLSAVFFVLGRSRHVPPRPPCRSSRCCISAESLPVSQVVKPRRYLRYILRARSRSVRISLSRELFMPCRT